MRASMRVAVIGATLLPGLVAAQIPIRIGQTVSGTLVPGDHSFVSHGRFKVYQFQGTQGQRLIFRMRSTAFDAYLTLARQVGPVTETLQSDDDSGGERNPYLRYRIPATGSYFLIAQALSQDVQGPYTLEAQEAPPPTTAAPVSLQPGSYLPGRLAETDAVDESDRYVDSWVFSGRSGETVSIAMDSDSIDSYLILGRMENGSFREISSDDDGGATGVNALIQMSLPASGEYVVHARALAGGIGRYQIRLTGGSASSMGGVVKGVPSSGGSSAPFIPFGTISGSLGSGDPQVDGRYYDEYRLSVVADRMVDLTMRSPSFDVILRYGIVEGGTYRERGTADDNASEGTAAVLMYVPGSAGEVVIRATSYSQGATGNYTLVLDSAVQTGYVRSVDIELGVDVNTSLNRGDGLSEGAHARVFKFSGGAGQRVRISARSSAFDTRLFLNRCGGVLLGSDDDGGGGTNSLLEVTLPETGEYCAKVRSYSAGTTGPFTIRVDRL